MRISLIINPYKLTGEARGRINDVREWVGRNLEHAESPEDAECIITLGGDGTLLYAMGKFGPGRRYFGVNAGHLGFLTSSEYGSFQADMAEVFLEGRYSEQQSYGLSWEGGGLRGKAVNDAVLKSADNTRIADFTVSINGSLVCSPKSDGLIVSTPMGSTAYNLSVGGPVMNPCARGFILNNIATHSLNMRPLILESHDVVSIQPATEASLIIDGGFKGNINEPVTLRSDSEAYFILRHQRWDFYDVMKRKLHWGKRGGGDD